MKRVLETSLAALVLAILYYYPFWTTPLPLFYGEFNSVDGSLQVVRFFDLIISILKQSEAGVSTADLCRQHGVSRATFYGWRKKYKGMEVEDAKRLKQLEDENRRLKTLVADLTLDKKALEYIVSKLP